MKKIAAAAVFAAIMMTFCSCGDDGTVKELPEESSSAASSILYNSDTASVPAAVTVETDNGNVTVSGSVQKTGSTPAYCMKLDSVTTFIINSNGQKTTFDCNTVYFYDNDNIGKKNIEGCSASISGIIVKENDIIYLDEPVVENVSDK